MGLPVTVMNQLVDGYSLITNYDRVNKLLFHLQKPSILSHEAKLSRNQELMSLGYDQQRLVPNRIDTLTCESRGFLNSGLLGSLG